MTASHRVDTLLRVLEVLLKADGGSVALDDITPKAGGTEEEILAYADFLEFLGVIKEQPPRSSHWRVLHAENSALVLKSLCQFRRAERPLLDDQRRHGNAKTWVRVLYELEACRMHLGLQEPIRTAMVAMAVMVGTYDSQRYVLVEHAHGSRWERFKFIGGKREAGEKLPSEVVQRELAEEIQDDIGDVLKLEKAPIVGDYEYSEVSRTRGALTHYVIVLFGVARYTKRRLSYTGASGRKLFWLPVTDFLERLDATPEAFSPVSGLQPVVQHIMQTEILYTLQSKDRGHFLTKRGER